MDINIGTEGGANIPKGRYRVTITGSRVLAVKKGDNKGLPLIEWELTVKAPPMVTNPLDGKEVKTEGQRLTRNTPAWKGAGKFLKNLVLAAGRNDLADKERWDTQELHGIDVDVDVDFEEFEGEMSSKVQAFHKAA